MRIGLAVLLILVFALTAPAAGQSLRMQVPPQQGAIVGEEYILPLQVLGGTAPYSWRVVDGHLPPGIRLHHSGKIAGVPTAVGDYHATVAVSDSSIPRHDVQQGLTIRVIEGLGVEWKQAPTVHGAKIDGSAVLTNETAESFNLTVLIVAVNEVGRATTLGYQHFDLAGGATSEIIPFGSQPGAGTYYVRVDAVGHSTHHKHVFRASKQTGPSLKVTQF